VYKPNALLEHVIPTYPEAVSLHADQHNASSGYGDNPSLYSSSREYIPALYDGSLAGPDTTSQPENNVFQEQEIHDGIQSTEIHINGMKVDG
jgi:hypothetical protein